ncbi:MAG: haloacid dehalogenase type II [Halovenus sp.]
MALEHVETVTFDSYSTLVDVDAVESALAARVDEPEAVSRHWRTRSLEYTMVANHTDAYDSFYELNRDALQHALDTYGADLSEAERDEILARYHELRVFDDVRAGLERIRDAGYKCYVLSNGNPEMLASMVEHADIGDLLADTISAEEIEQFKPSTELYRHAAARTGTPIDRIAHVSAVWFDVMGAAAAGMYGVHLNRDGVPWEPFDGEPDFSAPSIHDVVDELGV